MKKKFLAFAMAGLTAASMFGGAMPVFAANGVQEGTQQFGTGTESKSTTADITLTYDTTGGKWQEPGADATKTEDNKEHDNGTYIVTIPTNITYTNMAIGTVKTDDDYTVNVRGAIQSGQTVTLAAETGKAVVTNERKTDITETTTQGKKTWTADETFGTLNADGSLSGTNATDNIKMTGVAKAAGTYTGTVRYTATLK